MPRKHISLVSGEIYHVYNRGVDKRDIFVDSTDLRRFHFGIQVFNSIEPIQSIKMSNLQKNKARSRIPIVEVIAYCLLPNHFHLLLRQKVDNGISEYMKRLGGGYTSFFNERHERSGALFQGTFKRAHIKSDERLQMVASYINFNQDVHSLSSKRRTLSKSSLNSYLSQDKEWFVHPEIVTARYKNTKDYEKNAKGLVAKIAKERLIEKEMQKEILFE